MRCVYLSFKFCVDQHTFSGKEIFFLSVSKKSLFFKEISKKQLKPGPFRFFFLFSSSLWAFGKRMKRTNVRSNRKGKRRKLLETKKFLSVLGILEIVDFLEKSKRWQNVTIFSKKNYLQNLPLVGRVHQLVNFSFVFWPFQLVLRVIYGVVAKMNETQRAFNPRKIQNKLWRQSRNLIFVKAVADIYKYNSFTRKSIWLRIFLSRYERFLYSWN